MLRLMILLLLSTSTTLMSQTMVQHYELSDVWLLPDITHPYDPAREMTGTFEWVYEQGDFDNGSGSFSALDIPWYGSDFSQLDIIVDLGSIEFTLPGNWHSAGVDLTLHLVTPLSPHADSAVDITRSQFDIWNGPNYKGHVISGDITTLNQVKTFVSGTCPNYSINFESATPNSQLAVLYSFARGNFMIPTHLPCAGTILGLDQNTKLGILLATSFMGEAGTSISLPPNICNQIFIQALDLSSCNTSQVSQL